MTRLLIGLFLLTLVPSASCQQPDMEHTPFRIGEINYFGYAGVDIATVRAQLPLHPGDSLTFATFREEPMKAVITRITGQPPLDYAVLLDAVPLSCGRSREESVP